MVAEHLPSESEEHSVSSLASSRNRHKGLYDPFQDKPADAIAHFLIEAGHLKTSEAAAQYVHRILNNEGEAFATEQAMRDRLRELIASSANDDAWEDEDAIAGMIYDELRRTIDQAHAYADQRLAWRGLLRLRGVDVGEEGDPNYQRWQRLLHRLGEKALK